MELPTGPRDIKRTNPKELVIFGKPKCGKTSITAELTRSGNWCILELEEGGADFVEATVIDIENLNDVVAAGQAIIAADRPYDGIVVDTVSKLEDLIMPRAAELYRGSPMGVNWKGTDVRTLPKGSGYLYMRQAFFEVLDYIRTLAPNIILLGHLSDKMIDKKGEELSSKELDLTGKISSLTCARADAIAYCYRKDNQTILNFNSNEGVVCGARAEHLRGKEIVIAESDLKTGAMTYHWDKVYI
tara:strand:+ start:3425 stop:4156 length:732 start_codon:yes stop_codon:yes gene_type:complete